MGQAHKVVFYPVGNADTSQIITHNGKRFLFDFFHCKESEDPKDPRIDLKARLRKELKEAKRDYFDVVAFSHSDRDHICGSTDFFELRHAKKYQGEDRIKIEELWLPAAMICEDVAIDEKSEEFAIWRAEGRHRLLDGKGIKVFSKPPRLMDWLVPELKKRGEPANARDHLFVDAGKLVPGYTLEADGIEFFCHCPFIKHCEDGKEIVCNDASLIFNIRLRADGVDHDFLQTGDSTWGVLEDIVKKSKAHRNEDRLQWDLYNIPHHCSYLALSDEKGEKETTPRPLIEELLLKGKEEAYMVSSSKPIPDTKEAYKEVQPPHIQARNAYERYLEKVKGREFLVTMEEPNGYKPEPLTFEIEKGGIKWQEVAAGAAAAVSTVAPRAGLAGTSIRVG